MITCDFFENSFTAWQKGELSGEVEADMKHHAMHCADCSALQWDTIRMRSLLSSAEKLQPSSIFDFQLNQRLNSIARGDSAAGAHKPLLPRWAALGAGLATGLAVGMALFLPSGQEGNSMRASSPGTMEVAISGPQKQPKFDSLGVPGDSVKGIDADRHSQLVGSDR